MTLDEAIEICESSECARSHTYERKVEAMLVVAGDARALRASGAALVSALDRSVEREVQAERDCAEMRESLEGERAKCALLGASLRKSDVTAERLAERLRSYAVALPACRDQISRDIQTIADELEFGGRDGRAVYGR